MYIKVVANVCWHTTKSGVEQTNLNFRDLFSKFNLVFKDPASLASPHGLRNGES